jgi:hypothetical protein
MMRRSTTTRTRRALHHSITPSLHHSITPSLHHSITPTLQHSSTPSLYYSVTVVLPAYQLRLTPLVAPAPPFPPPAPPKITGSFFFPLSASAHPLSNSDAARSKTAERGNMSAKRRLGGSASGKGRWPVDIASQPSTRFLPIPQPLGTSSAPVAITCSHRMQ